MPKRTFVPREKQQTIRQELQELLDGKCLPIGQISKELGESEKDVYGHLTQLNQTKKLIIVPARCGKCGFVFENRTRVSKPSKCPKCKSTYIKEPEYSLKK